ncbi:hypothetical protein Halru_0540 [Halovivax ruber XH-70]|uniref:Uncharacterized protein n=1 Tax=Halovivax ruber (strain DSM 18193 / JCM 13892 / XH-70) TaxID=797302 RepID=L0I8N6_HALRX|nr:hypothetical protein [Halovivax ruber]AGB15173.1 hypothetical protein Halru_0540 [Halovivax ruber XH-70]
MMGRGRTLGLSALVVGAAALVGFALQVGRRRQRAHVQASIGARIVEEVPQAATVVDSTSRRLQEIPGATHAIERAVASDDDASWAEVTFTDESAWSVVDTLRETVPYYDGDDGEYNGVYVRWGDRIVVLDAVGWARLEEAAY